MKADLSIPGYDILEVVGEGGMATVWKGVHRALDRPVAIKVMHHRMSRNAEDHERFLHEIRAIARISHPNVVRAYDAGEQDEVPYYIMELVSGCTVGQLLEAQGALQEKDALFIAACLADALDYCWQHHQMIHCDIKPDNIMIDQSGTVKLADLGLARVLGRSHYEIKAGMTLGTPPYMSPEQVLLEEELDARADMYSLGAALYHMLTGHFPFESRTYEDILQGQLHGYIVDPREHNPGLSVGAAWLIEKLMVKDRSHRYPDWKTVQADIRAVQNGRMIRSPAPREGASSVSRDPGRKETPRLRLPAHQAGPVRLRVRPKARSAGGVQSATGRGAIQHQDLGNAILVFLATLTTVVGLYGFTLLRTPLPSGNVLQTVTP